MIPKFFHFIWIGDESKRPDECLKTWVHAHPDWRFQLWGDAQLESLPWVNRDQMMALRSRAPHVVADMMRWEILWAHGGIALNPDSICVRPLDDELLDCHAFACWESEIVEPGLLDAGYFGSEAENPFVLKLIEEIEASPAAMKTMTRSAVDSRRLTDCYRKFQYTPLRVFPSHYFIPQHSSGLIYEGNGPIYAHQLWDSKLAAAA